MQQIKPIGIFGGTFDPIHFGHLRAAVELYQQLQLSEMRFMPCDKPVHKTRTYTLAEHRLKMLNLAIQNEPGLSIDTRELDRDTPSYMILTLESLRAEFPNTPLVLIVGMDALTAFEAWYRWQDIFNFAHIVVIERPGSTLTLQGKIEAEFNKRLVSDTKILHQTLSGKILLQPTTLLNISATEIRNLITTHKSARYLLPDAVLEYIKSHRIY